ncbi:kinase-like domain-containing protein [Cercophora newfieldiana]|uniref:EKC/KEOPS complex subunit BUD32 n=1 Tax=Cercophora newfieldiana TaxID=92897 RepID=A0AA39YSZ4_9PEZI|nr:kinase-like domain-containing protein [Cercophora newfieldiana]
MTRTTPDVFMDEVHRLRAAYQAQRNATNLVPPAGRPVLDQDVNIVDGIAHHTYWYEEMDGKGHVQVIRLADLPNTLSGAILRLRCNLPVLDTNTDYEIIGNDIRPLLSPPPLPDFFDDSEDTSIALASLPEIEVDHHAKHFLKKAKYVSEIQNLLACQGGSCPGTPKSNHVIQLLGKSPNGELVFEKFRPRYVLVAVHPLSVYRRWILQLVEGLRCLHAEGVVHRDLRIDNLVFSPDGSRLLICDLEGHWGNRLAPEVSREPILDAGWTEKSDIFDLGVTIKGMIYGNTPITNLVEWHVPAPLDGIVAACTSTQPKDRPTLETLYSMVESIQV